MNPTEQRMAALVVANDKRTRAARLKRRIAAERGALQDVLLNPPQEFAHMALIDVVRFAYSKRSGAASLERLGRLAVRDGVNLMMPLGKASTRTRRWVAEHAAWHWHKCGESQRRTLEVRP